MIVKYLINTKVSIYIGRFFVTATQDVPILTYPGDYEPIKCCSIKKFSNNLYPKGKMGSYFCIVGKTYKFLYFKRY